MTITGEQVARARRLLGLSRIDLAAKAGLSETTTRNCENGKRPVTPSSVMAVRAALEAAGIEFDDKGHGVRMREGPKPDRLSKTGGPTGAPKQAFGGRKHETQEFADGDHVVYDGRDWKGAVSRRGNEWLAVTEGGKSLGYFADKALAVKAVLDTPAPREKKGRRP